MTPIEYVDLLYAFIIGLVVYVFLIWHEKGDSDEDRTG